VHLLDYLHRIAAFIFMQEMLRISSNPELLLVLRFVLLLVFALNPQQDPIILTC